MNGRTIPLGETFLHVLEAGDMADRARPLAIFLHGFPERAQCWSPQLAHFATTHRVVAPEQRGYGRSTRPAALESYRVEALVADVLALADHYGAGRFDLIGHDWGGIVAWFLAAAAPQRVRHLAIINAPHPSRLQQTLDEDAGQRLASAYAARLASPDFEATAHAAGLEPLWETMFGHHFAAGGIDSAARSAQLADWAIPGTLTAMTAWYRAAPFQYPGLQPGPFTRRPFPTVTVTVPTTLLWGMDDTALLPVQLEQLQNWVRDLTIRRIANAGHGVLHQQPATVTALLSAALASHEPI